MAESKINIQATPFLYINNKKIEYRLKKTPFTTESENVNFN